MEYGGRNIYKTTGQLDGEEVVVKEILCYGRSAEELKVEIDEAMSEARFHAQVSGQTAYVPSYRGVSYLIVKRPPDNQVGTLDKVSSADESSPYGLTFQSLSINPPEKNSAQSRSSSISSSSSSSSSNSGDNEYESTDSDKESFNIEATPKSSTRSRSLSMNISVPSSPSSSSSSDSSPEHKPSPKSSTSATSSRSSRFLPVSSATPSLSSSNGSESYDWKAIVYIQMKWCNFNDLELFFSKPNIKLRGKIQTSIEVVRDTCLALKELHACGYVHMDIKPANVFLHKIVEGSERDGIGTRVLGRLADFDSCVEIGSRINDDIGTIPYQSPEASSNTAVTESSDVSPPFVVCFLSLYRLHVIGYCIKNKSSYRVIFFQIFSLGMTLAFVVVGEERELYRLREALIEKKEGGLDFTLIGGEEEEEGKKEQKKKNKDIAFFTGQGMLLQLIEEMTSFDPSGRPTLAEVLNRVHRLITHLSKAIVP